MCSSFWPGYFVSPPLAKFCNRLDKLSTRTRCTAAVVSSLTCLHAVDYHFVMHSVLLHASLAVPGLPRARLFRWDALDVTNDTACGWAKCYIKSLQGEREDEGWLVGNREWNTWGLQHARAGFLTQWSRAWAFAQELRAHFGVDHLLRGPPFLATLSHVQARSLNARIQALDRQKQPKWSNPHRTVRMAQLEIGGAKQYYPAGPHPVQAVHSCSWPECMELRCEPLGFDGSPSITAQAIKGFVANAPNKRKLFLGIKQNFSLVIAMVKAYPCLRADFQVYLRNDGAWFNIDLDRCGDHPPFSDQEKIKLAQLPGPCGKRSSQLILDKAFEQLTGELSSHVSDSGN